MTTNMRAIIAAVGVALMVSPVMAQPPERHSHASAASAARAHGSVTRTYTDQAVHREPAEGRRINTDDCSSVWANCGYAH
jgi:hypothetical protein